VDLEPQEKKITAPTVTSLEDRESLNPNYSRGKEIEKETPDEDISNSEMEIK